MSHFTTFIATEDPANIDWLMEPFQEGTENMAYLEFEDHGEEVSNEYAHGTMPCIKLPGGKIVSWHHRDVSRFDIINGQVYQKKAGPLQHEMRTKKAKKLRALPEYPLRKLFSSLEEYAKEYHGYTFDEERQAFGYYCNPNAFWDWFVIGGRWPFQFLVKEGCDSAVYSEDCYDNENAAQEAPKGYQWVAGARKRDIEWSLMRDYYMEKALKRFPLLEEWFGSGVCPEQYKNYFAHITENGIEDWGHTLYVKGETLEQYLERNDLGSDCKYPVNAFSYVHDYTYYSQGDMGWFGLSDNDKPDDVWRSMMQDFLAQVPDEDFIVSLDCHI